MKKTLSVWMRNSKTRRVASENRTNASSPLIEQFYHACVMSQLTSRDIMLSRVRPFKLSLKNTEKKNQATGGCYGLVACDQITTNTGLPCSLAQLCIFSQFSIFYIVIFIKNNFGLKVKTATDENALALHHLSQLRLTEKDIILKSLHRSFEAYTNIELLHSPATF